MNELVQRVTTELQSRLGGESAEALGRFLEKPPLELPSEEQLLADLAKAIDHTLLKPAATAADIDGLCREAIEHGFASVCINSVFVGECVESLKGSAVKVCTVVGFPLGASAMEVKAFEARQALCKGASEIDMVLPVGRLLGDDFEAVYADIRHVAATAKEKTVKVILETGLLDDVRKIEACLLAGAAGARFVKTSTGFSGGGATVEDVRLMRLATGGRCEVKASGGIRDAETARAMIRAGATRLGTSSGLAIVEGTRGSNCY